MADFSFYGGNNALSAGWTQAMCRAGGIMSSTAF
jgi:hypothetical protein